MEPLSWSAIWTLKKFYAPYQESEYTMIFFSPEELEPSTSSEQDILDFRYLSVLPGSGRRAWRKRGNPTWKELDRMGLPELCGKLPGRLPDQKFQR